MVIESVGNCPPVLASKGEMPMSSLSIIVGVWLLLNAVVFAALMLRQDRSVLRDRLFRWAVDHEVRDRPGDFAAVGTSTHELSHVEGPALGGVESCVGYVGFGPGQTELAGEVIEQESSLANPTDSPSLRPTVGSN